MKYAIAGILSILIGFYIGYSNSPTHIDPLAGPYIQTLVTCTNSYPLSEKCIKSILKPCDSDRVPDRVTYAWRKYRDMDFLLVISGESMWDEYAVGDNGHAIGFCQYNSIFNAWGNQKYRNLNSWQERLEFCHWSYSKWKKDGTLPSKLKAWNVRHLNKLNINCYQ